MQIQSYEVFKQLGNGEFVRVRSCDALEEAVHFVDGLNETWPGKYVVRDENGDDVHYLG